MALLPDTTDPVDYEKLLRQWNGKAGFVARILDAFGTEAEADMRHLEEALAAGDAPQVACVAHRLKGAAATIGADLIRREVTRLEALARSGELREAPACMANLRTEMDRYRTFARSHALPTAG